MALPDLTCHVEAGMPTCPGDPSVAVKSYVDFKTDSYRISRLELGTHAGMHVDASTHAGPDGTTLDDFPANNLRFAAHAVGCRDAEPRGRIDPNATSERLEPRVDFLVFRTDWENKWGAERVADHPALEPETARVYADCRFSAGIDAPSPDPTDGDGVPAHHAILEAGLLVVESLYGLNTLPADRTLDLYVVPPRIDAGGIPARVVVDVGTGLIRRRDER